MKKGITKSQPLIHTKRYKVWFWILLYLNKLRNVLKNKENLILKKNTELKNLAGAKLRLIVLIFLEIDKSKDYFLVT